jgi:hypothetical protein
MNNPSTLPPNPAESDVQTPWPKTGDVHPATFLRVSEHCGFPFAPLMREKLTTADKKAMQKFLGRQAAATLMRDQNDIPGVLEQAAKIGRENNPHAICEAEGLRRKAATLSIDAYHAALAEITAIDRESRAFASAWCEKTAALLWPEFDREAAAAEARLQRFDIPLSVSGIREGYAFEDWTLHQEPLLRNWYGGIWQLAFCMPQEFLTPKFYCGTPLGLFADMVSEG